ncbi:hypothetical protein H8S33_13095 [Ornithinibacillus sp. BX22]|uniref:Triacylglycerol lipase n=1 Tax=Ornithinibacillus hominis TaxID=2763055 RepID=A0A923RJ81_9BACI|nr:hypothetical protein [Ornithinibacillus hominis]MBC5637746.1 hypothetical protein [Ornithinibacillus hominis]
MCKKLSMVFIICMLAFGLALPLSTTAKTSQPTEISDPTPHNQSELNFSITGKANNGNTETPGEWYSGETPPNLDPNNPVLLFVPGLNNVAQIFWTDNDMYQTAYDAGYQTAFIQLYDAGGASADMWDNGALLAGKIAEISDHFEGKKITVVAYSKGGVDTQTALTYYDAWRYVDNVITLSSPHHGSQLADLAYSSGAGWLANLLGAQGDGTYALQMGNMANFRSQIDNEPRAYHNHYYTLGGTSWGSVFSSTWFGGVYLSQYGANDGVVTAASSALPGGQQISIGDWNHTSIRSGITFPIFLPYLFNSTSYGSPTKQIMDIVDKNTPSFNHWVDGGPLNTDKANNITITVENDVNNLSLNLMTSNYLADIKLVSPSGKITTPTMKSTKLNDGIFLGAIQHVILLDKPESGEWSLQLTAKEKDAYLLVATFDSLTKLAYRSNTRIVETNEMIYQLQANSHSVEENSLKATYEITQSNNPSNKKNFTVQGTPNLSQLIPFHNRDEVYNITIDVEGRTKSGEKFKRTIIDSVYVK